MAQWSKSGAGDQALSASSGGGGLHIEEDRFSGLQEAVDQRHTTRIPTGTNQVLLKFPPINFI